MEPDQAPPPPSDPPGPARPPDRPQRPLPPVGDYLRAVLSLGLKSMVPALPALTLLCFYRVGMGLYLEFAVEQTSALGYPDPRAQAVHLVMSVAAYLPLLVLVYTPFLPLEDAILGGERRGFFASARHVLERLVPFSLSCLAQIAILAAPILAMFAGAGLLLSAIPQAPREVAAGLMLLVLLPALAWLMIGSFLMLFATPALILDGLGPIQSILYSAREVLRRFWSVFGRLAGFLVVLVVAVVIASFPASILAMAARVSGVDPPALKVARVLWTSVVTAATFPFWVAALMVLYRGLAPAGARAGAPAGAGARPDQAAERERSTPYIFE